MKAQKVADSPQDLATPQSVPVFLSVGRRYTDQQVTVLHRITSMLTQLGVDPLLPTEEPGAAKTGLELIESQLATSYGVVVVAFTRLRFEQGVEWPNSAKQVPIGSRNLPTVWLQIEAALAFHLRLPLLILVEDVLHPEALLNPKHREYGAHIFNMAACHNALPASLVSAITTFADHAKATARRAHATRDSEPER
jgi:hypothetical protein